MQSTGESSEHYRPSMGANDTLKAAVSQVMVETRLLYSAPKQVKTEAQAGAYLAILAQAIADECPDAEAVAAAWRDFKRTHAKGFWPTPGEFCAALRVEKQDRAAYRVPPPRAVEPPSRWNEVVTPEIRARTLEAIRQAEIMSESPRPDIAGLGKMLARLGYSIIERNGVTR